MRPSDADLARLWDMLRYARSITSLVQGRSCEEMATDEALRLAVERCIEVIGEAARHVPREIQNAHPKVPW